MSAFHYLVKAKLIRHIKESGEIDFLQFEEKFGHESPINARSKAFLYYQNYIDVLLEAKGIVYTSHKQAIEDLRSFVDGGTNALIQFKGNAINFTDILGYGIGIYLVVDSPMNSNFSSDKVGDEILVHGIGDIGFLNGNWDGLLLDLEKEFEYYLFYEYPTDNKAVEVVFCSPGEWEEGYREDEPATYKILETPFDWIGLDEPYWWGKPEVTEDEEFEQPPKRIEDLIKDGESNQIEFKPALLYNFSTRRGGIGIKGIIAKAICAFLNSNGGFLIIGISDNGKPQGLSYDFALSNGKNGKDFFMLEFDQMIEHFLSFSVKSNVSGKFFELDGKEIFVVAITPSKNRPIFMKGQNGKEFYIRGEASSRQLTDPEEIANYCIDKWGK